MDDQLFSRNPLLTPATADHARRIRWARRSLQLLSPAVAALLLLPMAAQAESSDPPTTTTSTQAATAATTAATSGGLSTKVHTVFHAVTGDSRSTSGTAAAANELAITVLDTTSTYGDLPVTYTVYVDGLKAGDTVEKVTAGLEIVGPAPDADAGYYPVTASYGSTGGPSGYGGVKIYPGHHLIKQAPLVVRTDDLATTYGQTPAFVVHVYGLRNGDTAPATLSPTSVVGGPSGSPGASARASAGSYQVETRATDPNYTVSSRAGRWTVNKAPLYIGVRNATTTWGDPVPAYTTDIGGLVNGETINDLTPVEVAGPTAARPDFGRYLLSLSGGTSPNYETHYTIAELYVQKRPVTVTADNKTRVYGSPNPAFTTTVTGMPAGMTLPTKVLPVSTGDGVGTRTIYVDPPVDRNLWVSIRNGTLTTVPAQLTITPEDKVITSGSVPGDLAWRSSGWVYDHTDARLVTRPTCTAIAASKPGVYRDAISCRGAQAPSGYTVAYGKATLTVNPTMSLQVAGLPTRAVARAVVDGVEVTLPRTGVAVGFGTEHSYAFPGVVTDSAGKAHITTAASFEGSVTDDIAVTASYSTMGELLSRAVDAGQLTDGSARKLLLRWADAEWGVANDYQVDDGLRAFAAQVRELPAEKLAPEAARQLLDHAAVLWHFAGLAGEL